MLRTIDGGFRDHLSDEELDGVLNLEPTSINACDNASHTNFHLCVPSELGEGTNTCLTATSGFMVQGCDPALPGAHNQCRNWPYVMMIDHRPTGKAKVVQTQQWKWNVNGHGKLLEDDRIDL